MAHSPICSLKTLVAGALLAVAILAIVPAAAQSTDDEPAATAGQSQGQDNQDAGFSDEQLKQFVTAQKNVQRAVTHWDPQIAEASDDEKDALRAKENKALVDAVINSGLKPQAYNDITRQAADNPALTKRIQSFMESS